MSDKTKDYLLLICWIVALVTMGSLLGGISKASVDQWYINLSRSPLTPPNHIFGVVWTMLYVMIAISGWLIWRSVPIQYLKSIKNLYIAQLLLNWLWTPLFFGYYMTGLALICLLLIFFFVALITILAHDKLTFVSLLMLPYLLWLSFATYLNFFIWNYNP